MQRPFTHARASYLKSLQPLYGRLRLFLHAPEIPPTYLAEGKIARTSSARPGVLRIANITSYREKLREIRYGRKGEWSRDAAHNYISSRDIANGVLY